MTGFVAQSDPDGRLVRETSPTFKSLKKVQSRSPPPSRNDIASFFQRGPLGRTPATPVSQPTWAGIAAGKAVQPPQQGSKALDSGAVGRPTAPMIMERGSVVFDTPELISGFNDHDATLNDGVNFGYLLSSPTNFSQALESRNLHVVQRFLARNFASVATSDYEWLQELDEAGHSTRKIAELLLEDIDDSPWIYFTPQMRVRHRIQTTFHVPGCAHQASSNTRPQSLLYSEDVCSRSPPLYTDVCRQVEELCGIGGVIPSSRDVSAWHGSVTFEDQSSLSVITYTAASAVAQQSRNVLVMKISNVLANFCAAAAVFQLTGLYCKSFTVLLRIQDCLELRRIEVHHAVKMAFHINQMLQDDNTEAAVQQ